MYFVLACTVVRLPILVAVLSEGWVCGYSHVEIVGSNPAGGIDVCLLGVLFVVRQRSLRQAYQSSRGVFRVWCV
jgi:hypothetical protein